MKVYISIDMDGICGVAEQVDVDVMSGGQQYEIARRLMTEECNAAIAGAFDGGATEVLVNDSHWLGLNLLQLELDERARVIRGIKKPYGMMQGLTPDTAAVMFIGYHASAGHDGGVLNHTMENTVNEVLLNGSPAGETRLNAALAGWLGVPVVLISGDNVVCAEARTCVENIETIEVKQAIQKYVALSLHPRDARERIREGASRSLRRLFDFAPYRLTPPITMRLELVSTSMAAVCEGVPGVKRVASRSVEYISGDYPEIYRLLHILLLLASTVESRM